MTAATDLSHLACVIASLEQGDHTSDGHKSHGGLGNLSARRARFFSALHLPGPALARQTRFENSTIKIDPQNRTYATCVRREPA